MSGDGFLAAAAGKNVLFVTTKNIDYIRNTQELRLIGKAAASVTVLGFPDRSYPARLMKVCARLATLSLRPFDLVFLGFSPQLVLPFFYPKLKKKAVWVDFFISLYDTMVNDRRRFRPSGPAAKILLGLDKATLARCNGAVAATRADAAYFAALCGADPAKLEVLYLEADREIYYPREPKSPAGKGPLSILYFGSILPLQGVEVIFACAERMQSADVLFQIIGPVPEKLLSRYRHLENLRLTPWLTQEELAARIAEADLCLAGHFNGDIGKAARTIPGKAFIYEAMGKPMILGDNPANREYFKEDGRHLFVKMGDAGALKEGILKAIQGRERP